MESESIKKEINESTAFVYLQKEIEKEKKKNKILSLIGSSLFLLIAILGFLTFGPFRIPVLSQLGNSLLQSGNELQEAIIVDTNTPIEEEAVDNAIEESKELAGEEIQENSTEKKSTTPTKFNPPTSSSVVEQEEKIDVNSCLNLCVGTFNKNIADCVDAYNVVINEECNSLYNEKRSALETIHAALMAECLKISWFELDPERVKCEDGATKAYTEMYYEILDEKDICIGNARPEYDTCASNVKSQYDSCCLTCKSN